MACIIDVHLQPGAKREGVIGRHGDAWKIAVRARAKEGEANEALCRLLAELFGLARRDVEIVSGHRQRRKRVRLQADAEAVRMRLEAVAKQR